MKAIFLLLMLLCSIVVQVSATTYYYSNAGNNANDGLTPETSRQTLAGHNAATYAAGDIIRFKCGDVFTGQLVPKSGSVGNPIIYDSYGTGAKPIFSGFETLTGWILQSGSIYRATTTATALNMLTVDGVNVAKGRYPNGTWLSYESHSGNTSITDNSLTGSPDFTGADVVIKTSRWKMDVATITTHSSNTLTFSAITDTPTDGFGYFFQNSSQVLDLNNEWYFTTGYVYIYSTASPSGKVIKAATTQILVNSISKSYYTLKNISFQGANDRAIKIYNPIGVSILDCDFSLCGTLGIESDGSPVSSGILIDNCTFSNINSCAIYSQSEATTITDCTFASIGLQEGMGNDNWGNYNAISVVGNNSTIQANSIQNIGYCGVSFRGNSTLVKYNYVNNFCNVLDDGGGIYTSTGTPTGRTIDQNIVSNGNIAIAGVPSGQQTNSTYGIYLDEGAADVTISNNTVFGSTTVMNGGILLHVSENVDVTGNTVYNCTNQFYISNNQSNVLQMTDINILNNIFVAKEANQICFRYASNYDDLTTFGTASGNVYARPISDTQTFNVDTYNTSATAYDLTGWKTLSLKDANSTKSPKSISTTADMTFAYNATASPVIVSLPFVGIDTKNVRYVSNPTLPAYSSIIVLKDITNPSGTLQPIGITGTGQVLGNPSTGVIFGKQ